MKINIKAVKTLYRAKRVAIESVKKLVEHGLITDAQYEEITGEFYMK